MANNEIHISVSDNQVSVPLSVGNRALLRSVEPDEGSPYYVGARAYVEQTAGGATITVIDKEGTTTATVSNGAKGDDGQDGADGFSPSATVSKVGDTATITITDKDGTTTASISDGSGDYNDILNKPQIEGVTLSGNKSFSDLSLEYLTNAEIEALLII